MGEGHRAFLGGGGLLAHACEQVAADAVLVRVKVGRSAFACRPLGRIHQDAQLALVGIQPHQVAVLHLADVAAEGLATIVYVSHRQDEYRDFFVQQLNFRPQ